MPSAPAFASSFTPLLRRHPTAATTSTSARRARSHAPNRRLDVTRVRCALAPPPTPMRPDVPSPDDHYPWARVLVGREDFESALRDAPRGRLVVVCFIASYCRVCKTLMNKVRRLAEAYPDLILFSTVNFATHENKPLCADLDVKLLPTFHFYRDASDAAHSIDAFTAGPFAVRRLIERLNLAGINVHMPP